MPAIASPEPGTFCWIELQTTDPMAARRFYGEVFGWSITDMPGDMPYGLGIYNGSMTAGFVELPAPAKAMGAPPNWLAYIAVDDVAATTAKAATLGARVLMPATAMGFGTFSVIQDPTGAVFALWHSPQSMGSFLYGEPGGLAWNELTSTDPKAAERFYTALFGWTCHDANMPGMTYSILKRNGVAIAGAMPVPKGGPNMSYWAVYFAVDDADATVTAAKARGAHVILPLMDVPSVGRFGFLADPQGAMFAVIRLEGVAS
jgi:predicted enzyme related to lactoylglutathione lyase